MIIRFSKKLLYALIVSMALLVIILIIFYVNGIFDQPIFKNNFLSFLQPPAEAPAEPTIGKWLVMPLQDYTGKALVIIENGKTVAREIYQPLKLKNGFEALQPADTIGQASLSSKFIIFNLEYSDTNELPAETINKYKIEKPFKEIYFCDNLGQPLTEAYANQLIEENKVSSTCQQLNGFLF